MKPKLPVKIACFITLLLLTTGYGCRSLQNLEQVYDSQDPYLGSPYPEALDGWTRKCRIYMGGLDLELVAAATFKSHAFREAYTAEYARAYKLSRAEQEKMLADQTEAANMYNDFVVSAYIPDKRWNDFDTKETIWKVYLSRGDEVQIKPVEVRRIKPVNAVLTHFFPYISPWDVVYLLRFPVLVPGTNDPVPEGAAGPVKLLITSVRGSAELFWGERP
ncbi:MAG: hypothetical protein AB1427_05155 [Thermodesulfobacteriota bacterium]